jgi:hypothetical protein
MMLVHSGLFSLVCFGGLLCVVKKRLARIRGKPYLTVGIVHGGLWCCLMGAYKVSYERAGTLNFKRDVFHRSVLIPVDDSVS